MAMWVQGVIKCSRGISYLCEYKSLQLGDLWVLQGCVTSLTVLQQDYIHSPQSLKAMYISKGIILLKVSKTVKQILKSNYIKSSEITVKESSQITSLNMLIFMFHVMKLQNTFHRDLC